MTDSRAKFIYTPSARLDFGERHVFPVDKYQRVRERVIAGGLATDADFAQSERIDRTAVLRVHSEDYLERLALYARTEPLLGLAEFEAPCFPEVIEAFEYMTGATLQAARIALDTRGFGFNIGGGFHHAMPTRGEGFCLLNDIAITIRALLSEGRIERATVVDVDVHQGNGTAVCFADEPRVFTFSLHNDFIYPVKERSTLDVGLPMHADDATYLTALQDALPAAFAHRPDLLVYLAGADPFSEDQLGQLNVSIDGLLQRDRIVLGAARAADVPTVVTLAGGYARRTDDVVEIHTNTARTCLDVWSR